MPNGEDLINELKYKERIKKLSNDEKIDYLVDKVFDIYKERNHKGMSKKQGTFISSLTSLIVSAITAYFTSNKTGS